MQFSDFSPNLVVWVAIGALVVFGVLVVSNRLRRVLAVAARGAACTAAIWGINFLVGLLGLGIGLPGINFLTMGIVAILGIPGLLMLYGVNLFL